VRSLDTRSPLITRLLTKDVETVRQLTQTAAHEFSPVCAVIGGMLAQDLLKALAGELIPVC
jgi:ubiquitin-like 1-activating enzyme E1 A